MPVQIEHLRVFLNELLQGQPGPKEPTSDSGHGRKDPETGIRWRIGMFRVGEEFHLSGRDYEGKIATFVVRPEIE